MKVEIEKSCELKILEEVRIAKVLPEVRGKLLDIGCGCNNLVGNYKGEGTGIDIFPWPGVDFVVEDTARLNFPNGTFNTVTFVACLNHIPNRKKVLKEANRILKPGGKIILTMISRRIGSIWHFFNRLWEERSKGRKFKQGEIGGLDCNEVIQLIKEAGFVLERREKFLFGINNLFIAKKQ